MATKQQREFLKSVLPNKFYIRKEMGEEQVYHYYINRNNDYGYDRMGKINQVIKDFQNA